HFGCGSTRIGQTRVAKVSFAAEMDWCARLNCWRMRKSHCSAIVGNFLHMDSPAESLAQSDGRFTVQGSNGARFPRRAAFSQSRATAFVLKRQEEEVGASPIRNVPAVSSRDTPLASRLFAV